MSYARLAEAPVFAQGINRLEAGSVSERIAIMCAEGEPLDCHRTVLVSPVLVERDHPVMHIHRDGALEEHETAMRRLRAQWGLLDADLFHGDDELTAKALLRQESKIAFVADDEWAAKIGIL